MSSIDIQYSNQTGAPIKIGNLQIDPKIKEIVDIIAEGLPVDTIHFWKSYEQICLELGPQLDILLSYRDSLQQKIDQYHKSTKGFNLSDYKEFLTDIGYIQPEGETFSITTENVDNELTNLPAPQLVCPIDNARFAVNAINARYGSLYDALYSSDMIPEDDGAKKSGPYNTIRGKAVELWAEKYLDDVTPLENGLYSEVTQYDVLQNGTLVATLQNGSKTELKYISNFVGYNKKNNQISEVILRKNGLHIIILVDPSNPVGKGHRAGVKDVIVESNGSVILDMEDSCCAVDGSDKSKCYANWFKVNSKNLLAKFQKGSKTLVRDLNNDKTYLSTDHQQKLLKTRALCLVRNVGHHMFTDAVTLFGKKTPEGFLDCMVSALCSFHDLKLKQNSQTGSHYIVKPKMHGPQEVQLTVDLFDRVEKALGLKSKTLKLGIMDEERRTSINLFECVRKAKERVFFINTGFLDRTGDDIHTTMFIGPQMKKGDIKKSLWIKTYEAFNVDVALQLGFPGRAQIGKGMWAQPDNMKAMFDSKMTHLKQGANTAWVPNPVGATLHSIHYQQCFVPQVWQELNSRVRAKIDDMLVPAILDQKLNAYQIQRELDNNVQGLLGYVVRWIQQGIGCSKVPDLKNVGLMEDRATLRISSQHITNWLANGIITKDQVEQTLRKMAPIVDQQNKNDRNYINMSGNFDTSLAYKASQQLIYQGLETANGYTEDTLTEFRRKQKLNPKL